MCFASTPKAAPTPPPENLEASADIAKDRLRRRARLAYGQQDTITGAGTTAPPLGGQKSLLGQ